MIHAMKKNILKYGALKTDRGCRRADICPPQRPLQKAHFLLFLLLLAACSHHAALPSLGVSYLASCQHFHVWTGSKRKKWGACVNTVPEALLWIFSGKWLWIRTIDFGTQWGSGSQSPTEDPLETVRLCRNRCKRRKNPATLIRRGPKSLVVKVKTVRLRGGPMAGLHIFDWLMAAFTYFNDEILLFCWCRFASI